LDDLSTKVSLHAFSPVMYPKARYSFKK
jgi:hypothetical protein